MEITTELNGIKYLVVEMLITDKVDNNKLDNKLEKHEVIYQGIKEINSGGFWSSKYIIARLLVPEKNVVAFNKEKILK